MMYEWINLIVLGALLGATGQAARSIVGWKKIFDEVHSTGKRAAALFRPARLVVSLIVGAVAGMLAALTLVDDPVTFQKDMDPGQFKQFLLALVATGYAGADFIEGFVRRGSSDESQADELHESSLPPRQAPATTR